MIRTCQIAGLLAVLGCLAPPGPAGAQQSDAPPPARRFEPRTVIPVPMKPIENAPVAEMAHAADHVADNELVLGVVVGEQARAYPINMLCGPSREIVNDQLGGRAIAATW